MANVHTRDRADGGTGYQVQWVLGGDDRNGAPVASQTFSSLASAKSFKRQVEARGGQWPEDRVENFPQDGNAHAAAPPATTGQSTDWRRADGRKKTCRLCRGSVPTGQWGYADGPLCRPDDPSQQNCYQLWVIDGARPSR